MGLRSGHYQLVASNLTCASPGLTLLFVKTNALCPGEVTDAHKADVMAVMGINSPRIAQAYD
ncbi:hypothetical protein ES703_87084 [subsurface metagenome]